MELYKLCCGRFLLYFLLEILKTKEPVFLKLQISELNMLHKILKIQNNRQQ